jgi:hypothetical protein
MKVVALRQTCFYTSSIGSSGYIRSVWTKIISPDICSCWSPNTEFHRNTFNSTKLEILTAIKILVVVFWIVTPCTDVVGYQRSEDLAASIFRQEGPPKLLPGVTTHLHPEDVGSMLLRNVGILPLHLHGVKTQKTTQREPFVTKLNITSEWLGSG